MSTSIDYQRKAFFEVDKYGDRVITVLAEIGSSNCFESQTGRRARDWYVNFHGAQYSVYGRIANYAGAAAGGMLVIGRMGTWRRADYLGNIKRVLRAYDEAIKNARPIEEADPYEKEMIRAYHEKQSKAEVR